MTNKYPKSDPRARWTPEYQLIKIYPGFTTIGMWVDKNGIAQNGVMSLVHNPDQYPEYWAPMSESKKVIRDTILFLLDTFVVLKDEQGPVNTLIDRLKTIFFYPHSDELK